MKNLGKQSVVVFVRNFSTLSLCWCTIIIMLLGMMLAGGQQPIAAQMLIIDAAPSVVSYQGSSQSYANLVISPRGRALGYVAPLNLNHTIHDGDNTSKETLDYLHIRPVYISQ